MLMRIFTFRCPREVIMGDWFVHYTRISDGLRIRWKWVNLCQANGDTYRVMDIIWILVIKGQRRLSQIYRRPFLVRKMINQLRYGWKRI